jgi:two-component system OmpR family response regulator
MALYEQSNILIVEDDADIAAMLVELLTDNGFTAQSVANGAEMDRLLRFHKFDLIVLDGMLPGEDGFSICMRLRATRSIPILILTARREDIDRILGLELGADDYVTSHSTLASCSPASKAFCVGHRFPGEKKKYPGH